MSRGYGELNFRFQRFSRQSGRGKLGKGPKMVKAAKKPDWLKDYYATGKRGSFDGAPCWRPKWWNTLGNDREFREATRETYNPAHYPEGTIRIVRDGIPYRFAAHVAKWKPSNRAALCQGYDKFGLTLVGHGKNGRGIEHDRLANLRAHYGDKSWKLSWRRNQAESELNEFQFPPDLFVWARRERKRRKAAQSA